MSQAGGAKTLFHGTTLGALSKLRASQPNMGAEGVYGADNLDWAALYALAQDRKGMAVLGGAHPKLLIHKANKLAPEGYVYEYNADNPTPPPSSDPNLGWSVSGNVTPLRKHVVKLVDHMKNIEQFDDKESLRKRWEELRSKSADLAPDVQLQEHQQRIADRVSGEDPRMLVYHGLGSGKSLSAIAAAEAAKKLHGGNYGVVVPASLKGNFEKEIGKFTRNSSPEILSYTGLGSGKQFKETPDTLIMDEAARLRNPNAAMSRAALQNAARAKRVMLLTGTPITNEPKDLASLISIVRNEKYDPAQFDKDFVGEKRVWPSFWGFLQGAGPGVKPIMKNGPKLRSLLEGHVDYQPSKTPEGVNVNEETVNVPLSKEQQRIQKAIRTKVPPGFLWKLDQEFPLSREELAKLNSFMTGMRQVSLSTQPFRADKDPLKAFGQSAKLQEAFKRLRANLDADPRKKAIIYSNFVDAGLGPYAAGLEANKIPHGIFHGGIPTQKRLQALKDYNEGKLRALLIGPAGAEGLSTKGTSLIQLLDPYWNESRLQQARGRGLRFDSHAGLPEDLKNVAVQRYLSTSDEPGLVGKLMGQRRQRTGDEVIQRMSAEKEQLNEQFRNLLREVGTRKKEESAQEQEQEQAQAQAQSEDHVGKKAAANTWGNIARQAGQWLSKSPVMNLARVAGGGAAGYYANDKYLDRVNPEVSDLGRLRSNLLSGIVGGTLSSRGALPAMARNPGKTLVGAGALAGRAGVIMPDSQHAPLGFGLGKTLDPGHSKLPKAVAWTKSPENIDRAADLAAKPVENASYYAADKGYDAAKKQLEENKGEIAKQVKDTALPAVYGSLISSLGGKPGEKPTLADVGMAAAPHVTGGAGGAYLGYLAGQGAGNFFFKDNPKADYEERRRQEQRRWWLEFLGGNLGAVGGAAATAHAMPYLNKTIGQYMTKKSAGPFTGASNKLLMQSLGGLARKGIGMLGTGAKELGKDVALGGAMTGGQYAAGMVPAGQYDAQGKPMGPNTDLSFTAPLLGLNTLLAGAGRRMAVGRTPFLGKHGPNPITRGLTMGAGATAGPSVINATQAFPGVKNFAKKFTDRVEEFTTDTGGLGTNPGDIAASVRRGGEKALANKPVSSDAQKLVSDVAEEAAVPGMSQSGNKDIKGALGAGTLAALGQGAGIATGGVAGLVGGDWLADKVLGAAVKRKWLKKRPALHKFIRDLASVAGAGLGAYGGMQALNYGIPGAIKYYNEKLSPATLPTPPTPPMPKIVPPAA